jgi:hypothetical protein
VRVGLLSERHHLAALELGDRGYYTMLPLF